MLRIYTLGHLTISTNDQVVANLNGTKTKALLIYLACTGRTHSREFLAELLWNDRSQTQSLTNLRKPIAELAEALQPYMMIGRREIALNPGSYWLDVAELETTLNSFEAQDAHPNPDERAAGIETALSLYRGDFLEGFYVRDASGFEEWMRTEQDRLRQRVIAAMTGLVESYLESGNYQAGITQATHLLHLAPLVETGHRQMMLLLTRAGRRSAALTHYDDYRRLLTDELDAEPDRELTDLYEQIRSGQIGMLSIPKSSPKSSRFSHNLPPQPTPFIGRTTELAQIAGQLANPTCRLLTLVGPGGIGKTRLALQIATGQMDSFADGVYFVPLASVVKADFLISAIASAINFPFHVQQDVQTQLNNYLHDKNMLLVMDNFEHLLAGATILTDILAHAPQVKILVTSRERLNVPGEYLIWVGGLLYPDSAGTELESYSAVQLFVQAAQRIDANFSLERDQESIIRLCQLTAGMPLAIELAASWVHVLSCRQIAAQIEHNLDLLTTELHNIPERHRNMRAVFEHSWVLLSEAERTTLMKLAVFRNGFTAEAAQQVAGASLPMLANLMGKSLLRRTPSDQYEIHELLRQYAEEHLNQNPDLKRTIQETHCKYYAAFMKRCEAHLHRQREAEVMSEIEQDFDNILNAWRWAVDYGEVKDIRDIIYSLDRFLALRSLFTQKLQIFQQAAEKLEATQNPSLKLGIVLGFLSICYGDLGDTKKGLEVSDQSLSILHQYDAPRELAFILMLRSWIVTDIWEKVKLLEESLAILRSINEITWVSNLLQNLSMAYSWLGDYERSSKYGDEAIEIAKKMGSYAVIADLSYAQGTRAVAKGKYAEAKRCYQQGMLAYEKVNHIIEVARYLNALAFVALLEEKYAEADRNYQKALTINREIGYQWAIGANLRDLGMLAFVQGNYTEAERLSHEALDLLRELDKVVDVTACLNNLAHIAVVLGHYSEIKQYLSESLGLAQDSGLTSFIPSALIVWVDLLTRQSQFEKAVEVLSFVRAYLDKTPEHLYLIDHYFLDHYLLDHYFIDKQTTVLKGALSADLFDAAGARGEKLELETLIKECLRTT